MGAGSSDGKRGNFPPFDPLFCYKADSCVFNPWKNAKILKNTRPYALENRLNVSFLSWLKKARKHPSRGLEGCLVSIYFAVVGIAVVAVRGQYYVVEQGDGE